MSESILKDRFQVRPADKQKAIEYYKQKSFSYNDFVARNGFLKYFREREKSAILKCMELEDSAKKSLIDVGCGGGTYSLLAKHHGKYVCSADISSEMIEALRDKVDETLIMDIEDIQHNKTYDIVLCLGILDFVVNPDKAFHNLCSLVAENGKLVILVPRVGVGGLLYRLEKHFSKFRVNLFTQNWLIERAKTNGLELKRLYYPLQHNMVLQFEKKTS